MPAAPARRASRDAPAPWPPAVWLWGSAGALLMLVALVFEHVRFHTFLQFDDADYVTENGLVRQGLTWAGVQWAFVAPHAGNWHPVTWISHMLDVQLFGMEAGRHLLMNVALHAGTSVLLLVVLRRATGRVAPSLCVAALFAVHPLHVESVAWVAERKDVLSTFWWVLTIAMYQRFLTTRARAAYAGALGLFVLALLSKPMVVTLPLVLLLLDVWPLDRVRDASERARAVREVVPFLVLGVAASAVTFLAQRAGGAVQSAEAFPWGLRAANVPIAYLTYLVKTVWPVDLAALYPYPTTIPLWRSLGATLLLAGITWGVTRMRAERPYLLVGWLWFLVTLLPVIGVIQVGSQPFADRYMYVPSIGLFIMVVWTMADAVRGSATFRAVACALAIAAVSGSAFLAHRQVAVWQDSVTLWEHAIAVTDSNYRAHTNLGFALAERGESDRAIAEYREAIGLEPAYANAHNYLGALLSERGRPAEGVAELRRALATRPRFVEAHNNLGLALTALGQTGDAIGAFREAVRLNPAFAPAWNNLGIALADADQLPAAIDAFRQSVRYQPGNPQAHFNLGTALADAGRTAEARAEFEAALTIDPTFSAAREAIKKL